MKSGRFLRPMPTKQKEGVGKGKMKETMSARKSLRQKVVNISQGKASAKPGKLHVDQDWPW